MLNNPQILRETMELARNPSALQELMRHHDRAISNLEVRPKLKMILHSSSLIFCLKAGFRHHFILKCMTHSFPDHFKEEPNKI